MKECQVALIQMKVGESKQENLDRAELMVREAANQGADLVVLPEMFNCPYQTEKFPLYAEFSQDLSWQAMSRMAKENRIILVGGSVPERDSDNRIYNTAYVFNSQGQEIAKHRKMHLFDIDIQGGQYFKESDTLTAGNTVTVFQTPFGTMGLMICYDLRFPELARLLVDKGAKAIFVPGAFNMTTGPAHWELLFQARALDNQAFMFGVAPARDPQAGYVSYANSLAADPWGEIAGRLGTEEEILLVRMDLAKVEKIRQQLPLLKHRRRDIYQLLEK